MLLSRVDTIQATQVLSPNSTWFDSATLAVAGIVVAILIAIVTIVIGSRWVKKQIQQGDKNTRRLEDSIEKLNSSITRVEHLVPSILRIHVSVDQSSPSTGTWGEHILYGVNLYFRRHGREIIINNQRYIIAIDSYDDQGLETLAKEHASALLNDDNYPTAIIGPISSGCAAAALTEYHVSYTDGHRPAIHLLPVPTATSLVDGVRGLPPFVFRMPPNNAEQASTIIEIIIKKELTDSCGICYLECAKNKSYILDMKKQLDTAIKAKMPREAQVPEIFLRSVSEFDQLEFQAFLVSGLKIAIVVGSWRSEPSTPDVQTFLNKWRKARGSDSSTLEHLILTDFPVPDAEADWLNEWVPLSDVHAVFQYSPSEALATIIREKRRAVVESALIGYGYDAANILETSILRADSVDGRKVAESIIQIGILVGISQEYRFDGRTRENIDAKFHVYKFPTRENGDVVVHDSDFCCCEKT